METQKAARETQKAARETQKKKEKKTRRIICYLNSEKIMKISFYYSKKNGF